MNKMFYPLVILFLLAATGCASRVEKVGFDAEKASIANTELGTAYLAQGKYNVAMVKFKKALKYNDDNVDANHYIAELYRRLEQNSLAEKHFHKAMELDENNSAIKNNYAIFLCGTNSYEKGMKLLNKVLLDPLYADKGQVYENMGLCAEKQGNIQYSEQYYETALKFNKKLPAALLGLAQISFDKKNVSAATNYLNRYNNIALNTPQSLWLELLIAHKEGHKGKVGSLALKLKQLFPDSREVKLLKKLKLR
jgi:type IV pilus assembly protein PilF